MPNRKLLSRPSPPTTGETRITAGTARGLVRLLLAAAATVVLWASAFAGIRAGLVAYTPEHLALLRFLIASATLAGYAVVTRMRLPARRDLPAFLLVGFLGITLYNLLLNTGQRNVSAGAASLLVNIGPIFTALLAMAFLGERLRAWGWLGMGASFCGAFLIALGQGDGLSLAPGAILVLLAALAQSLYFVRQKPLLTVYRPLECTTYVIWAGTLWLLIFLPGLPDAARAAPLDATLAVVYLGLFPAALAYICWAYVLAHLPASRAASFLYLVPPVAFVIGWLWLGEVPAGLAVIGGAIALAGVLLVQTRGRVTSPAASAEARKAGG